MGIWGYGDITIGKNMLKAKHKGHQVARITQLSYHLDTGRKLNVHKTLRRRPGRLLNVLCTLNLRPVSRGYFGILVAHFEYISSSFPSMFIVDFEHVKVDVALVSSFSTLIE